MMEQNRQLVEQFESIDKHFENLSLATRSIVIKIRILDLMT